ncbi:MAG: YceI family protein [Bacteroidota bacterium]
MNKYLFMLAFLSVGLTASAQKFQSSKSHVKFFSDAPVEDIEAVNETARSIIDVETGELVYAVTIKDFQFDKSLMQEHFNENYMESEKYPKSTLNAKIQNWNGEKGVHEVTVAGELTIHGVTKKVEIDGTINYDGDMIKVSAKFPVELKEYKIKIPKVVFMNIAEVIEVTVAFEYKPI